MENPWLQLPAQAPYVLPCDSAAVTKFNATAKAEGLIHTELLPEPFIGRPDAPVVLLTLNPGYDEGDLAEHTKPEFIERCRGNLRHAEAAYPLYLLDPVLSGPGQRYWEKHLGPLVKHCGSQQVARSICVVEYFPYHSDECHHRKVSFQSQAYGFALVKAAVSRGALVVLMRSETLWFGAVPELATYPALFALRSPRKPYVSMRNCPDGFQHILARIE